VTYIALYKRGGENIENILEEGNVWDMEGNLTHRVNTLIVVNICVKLTFFPE
jgi:hypothetical protein